MFGPKRKTTGARDKGTSKRSRSQGSSDKAVPSVSIRDLFAASHQRSTAPKAKASFQDQLDEAIRLSSEEHKKHFNATNRIQDELDEAIRLSKAYHDNVAIRSSAEATSSLPARNTAVPESCPVCLTNVAANTLDQFEEHVNACIDALEKPVREESSNVAPEEVSEEALETGTSRPASATEAESPPPAVFHELNQVENQSQDALEASMKGKERAQPAVRRLGYEKPAPMTASMPVSDQENAPTLAVNGPSTVMQSRSCPFYKRIQDTPYVVDAFSYGKIQTCEGYFLSHFHSDHYHGLNKTWTHGPIYCSTVTAKLVVQQLAVAPNYLQPLPMNQACPIDESLDVTLIDANHCPGSVLFLFKHQQRGIPPRYYLHTGDFRACPKMVLHPAIQEANRAGIQVLYLDTTYLSPSHSFPAQEEAIGAACQVVQDCVAGKSQQGQGRLSSWLAPRSVESATDTIKDRLLVVVGTYLIGKEKLVYQLAKLLDSKIYANNAKRRILSCQDNPDLLSLLTDQPREAQVHIVPLSQIKLEALQEYLEPLKSDFTRVIAFRPTGWTFRGSASSTTASSTLAHITAMPPASQKLVLQPQTKSTPTIQMYGVPYSEHSSFRELAAFIGSLDIRRIIPTVNVARAETRQKMAGFLDAWRKERKQGGEPIPYRSQDYW
ncbi:DNA repair metallo-beta-lactamase-domain-containing protein [Syncephalastrum racemosum]|uniref:DNA repair metallo-beta-lactamase-domain-containing protein n=1 Tax=Syncephalastrum racemosum TaxID=13706 RepID=A0A1X2HMM8_SYNRA|nr:DNA repair metallo-beta-lactamase-domain-containing protein [Syncephalastrum racemosum]